MLMDEAGMISFAYISTNVLLCGYAHKTIKHFPDTTLAGPDTTLAGP